MSTCQLVNYKNKTNLLVYSSTCQLVNLKKKNMNKEMNQGLHPGPYGKSELALLYFPNSTPWVANSHLRRWINRIPELRRRLLDTHYQPTQKFFTAPQVKLIVEYLGEP